MNAIEFEVLRAIIELQNSDFHSESFLNTLLRKLGDNYDSNSLTQVLFSFYEKRILDEDNCVTEVGYLLMEPYRVKNAIILAAGMSTRFIPVSYEIPKGLISVKGEVLIEREIRQLYEVGVQEIVVVIGYMMEKFFYLRDKYKVKLVVNNEFSTKNTHSSVYAARDYLSNTYILCSDNYYPKNLFHQYEYRAFYCSTFLPGTSYSERAVVFDNDGLIISTNKPSRNQWIMSGHAYFDEFYTKKYIPLLESYYGKSGVENMYWENVWTDNIEKIPMWIRKYQKEDILEFDSMDDLKAFDSGYIYNNRVHVFENICKILGCEIGDIKEMEPIKKGLSNQSFIFKVFDHFYIYRNPGFNTSKVVNRKQEAMSLKAAKKLGIDDTLVYIDEDEGWKISKYIEITEAFNFKNINHVTLLASCLKILHDSRITVGYGFNYQVEANKIILLLRFIDALAYRRCLAEQTEMEPIFAFLSRDQWQVSLCHNDLYEPNLLLSNNKLSLIDWEYAGDADIGFDICKLFTVSNPNLDECDDWLFPYFGRKPTLLEKRHLCACAAVIYYYWYIWGIFTGKNNQDVSEYLLTWYEKMRYFRLKALEMIGVEV